MIKTHYCEFKTLQEAKEFAEAKQLEGWKLLCGIFVTQWKDDIGEDTMVADSPEYAAIFYTDD